MDCNKCNRKNTCKALCEAAEKFVDQDRVGRKDTVKYIKKKDGSLVPRIRTQADREILVNLPKDDEGNPRSEGDYLSYLEAKHGGSWVDYMVEGSGDFKHPDLSPLTSLIVGLFYGEGLKWRAIQARVYEETGRLLTEKAIHLHLVKARKKLRKGF